MGARVKLTRRSLLAAGTAALGAPLVGPTRSSASRAERAGAAGELEQLVLGRIGPGTRTLALARVADLVGVEWHGAHAGAGLEIRYRTQTRGWSEWVRAASAGHGPDVGATGGVSAGEPVWTGGTTELQLRSAVALEAVRVHLIDVSGGRGAARVAREGTAAALALASPVLAAGPGQPPIIAREAWAQGRCAPGAAPTYGAVELAFVHHTDNPNGYGAGEVPAMLRAIYVYHRYARGWHDIGYNFVVDLYGRAFEARAGGIDESVVGAQAGGFNLFSTGVAVLGTFSARAISEQARRTLEALLSWKLSLHGVPAEGSVTVRVNPAGASYSRFPPGAEVLLPRVAGHREADTTDCPGNVLYAQLGAIRAGALRIAGSPVQATIALVSSSSTTIPSILEGALAPGERYLFGTLSALDGAPLAGAQVSIQSRALARRGELVTETTIAQATTNQAGEWALPAAPQAARGRLWLRALYAGAGPYGAAVSEAVHAALAPVA